MLALLSRCLEFLFYHCLLSVVDRVSRLPRNTTMPEAARLYRENIALKTQLDVVEARLRREEAEVKPRPRRPLRERAAQVFAYLLTRENEPFQRYFLSAPLSTIRRWSCRFRKRRYEPLSTGGRPGLAPEIKELILTLKRENRPWGQRRISEELRRIGVRVCARTIRKVLEEGGFPPGSRRKTNFERFFSSAKDAIWALDYFAVKTAKNRWLQVLMIMDIHTRERIDLRVYDGWDVDSWWTIRMFRDAMARCKRKPARVVHDHGSHFAGQFERQLRVLEIEQVRTVSAILESVQPARRPPFQMQVFPTCTHASLPKSSSIEILRPSAGAALLPSMLAVLLGAPAAR